MRHVAFTAAVALGSFVGLALVIDSGRASLFSPDEPLVIPVGPDGVGRALLFGDFRIRYAEVSNEANTKVKDGKINSDREKVLKRIEQRKGRKLTATETAAQAADLLRLGRTEDSARVVEAMNLIKPKALDRSPNYFVLSTLAHIHAAQGQWRQAVDNQVSAIIDSEMPPDAPGLTKNQRTWIEKLDRNYVLPYFQFHLREAEAKPDPVDEDVYPLFPPPERNKPHHPVRFVNETGVYQPGTLAAAERAKLPPDAIAIVQQLLLWFPTDPRLYWLLAELYAADGQLEPARIIMDGLVSEDRKYGNRKLLAEHRHLVRAADDARPKPVAPEDVALVQEPEKSDASPTPATEEPISMRTVWIYFGAVAVIGVFALARAVRRRVKGECGPVG